MTPSATPGLRVRHNSDIDPTPSYLEGFPLSRALLRNEELLASFRSVDRLAGAAQKRFHAVGLLSLALGIGALIATAWDLCLTGLGVDQPPVLSWIAALCALLSVALALGPRITQSRSSWLSARFMTEQMRQWHFQSWLDGDLVSAAAKDPAAFERERTNRWARFQQRAWAGEGGWNSFVDAEGFDPWHQVRPYLDPYVAQEIFAAYLDLRFRWQTGYMKLKQESIARFESWTESLARWTMFSAVLLAAIAIVVLLITGGKGDGLVVIGASALTLAVMSAGIQVYRSAHGLTEERERYAAKWTRLVSLEKAFVGASDPSEKQSVMQETERMAAEELREFLRVKRRAGFLL